MFFPKTTLLTFVSLALTLQSTASPVSSDCDVKRSQGVAIPLGKRTGLKTDDGVFDLDKAVTRMVRTQNKHSQNLRNYQANTGSLPFNGAKVFDFIDLSKVLGLGKRQSLALENDDDIEWLGPVTVGSNQQEFMIDFDTGSADFWVPAASCNDTICQTKHTYDSSTSTSSKQQEGQFSIHYGDGTTVGGDLYTDDVTVAGITAEGQYLAAVGGLSSSFSGNSIDGIMGLAYPALSNINQNPWFTTANSQGKVQANQFSFYLADNGSELYLGGANNNFYTGDFDFHDVEQDKGYWTLGGATISINGQSVVSDAKTIVDSGTTIMYGPPGAVKELYGKLNGTGVYSASRGFYYYPCNTPPKVTFNWGGKDWTISDEHLSLGTTDQSATTCIGAIAAQDIGLGDNVWLLGDSFMKNFYTTFNFQTNQIGFAELKQGETSQSQPSQAPSNGAQTQPGSL